MRSLAVFTLGVVSLVGASRIPTGAQQPASPWSGRYTDAQAARGQTLYGQYCANCHTTNLGGGDRAPAAGGPALIAKWSARPLEDLFNYMQGTMPLNNPGQLRRQQNADILAFMLSRSGVAAGSAEFVPPAALEPPVRAALPTGPLATPVTARLDAYYTPSQALRGKAAFNRNCLYCHGVDPARSTPADLKFALPSTFAGHFLERIVNDKRVYPNVYVLYSKLQSMPATDTASVSAQARVDIAAYILQLNGYPAGPTEIPTQPEAMKLMNLNEEGFEPVFNGRDFSGLRFRFGLSSDPAPMLRIENGVLVCECNVHGEWSSEKRYFNFTLRYDTRFERPPDWSGDDELFSGGSGIFILGRPTGGNGAIEIEGRHRDLMEAFAVAGKATWSFDLDARRRVIRPLGEWQSIEVVAKDGRVTASLNGTLITTITEHDYTTPAPIRFQSQGAKMYWRNVRVRPE